jgi:hypothetical protein
LAIVLAGCGTGIIPGDVAMPAGSREWIISVDNQSAEGARLLVALDTMPVGDLVGTANPAVVPPNTKSDVVFHVPPGQAWAIFVNPSSERGPLLLASDVPPDVAGQLPITFHVDARGDPSMSIPNVEPGWMGE